MGHVPN